MSKHYPTEPAEIEVIPPGQLAPRSSPVISMVAAEEEAETQIDVRRLIRRYAWLVLLLMILGLAGGFVSVVLATPMYRSRLLLDIQPLRTMDRGAQSAAAEESNLQTQMLLIRSSGFLNRVVQRMQSETLPVAPVRNDFFTKLRTRVRPEMRNSTQLMNDGITAAMSTLQVRPVNGTTLLEISCESIHPELAANFANTVGSEFIDQSMQARSLQAQQMSQWLSAQVEETKSKLHEAEEKLNDFVRSSGNLFVSSETTLADSDMRSFQGQAAAARAERLAKQSEFEMIKNASPEERVNLLRDGTMAAMQLKLQDLRQQRLILTSKYTPNHYKVQTLDLQIKDTEKVLQESVEKAYNRVKSEFEASQRREKLLSGAYSSAAGQVSAQAGQAAQYSALRREVDILRQTYGQILMQASQTSITNALPQSNMRVVDMAAAAQDPLRPKPPLSMAFGAMLGLVASAGIIFLRERMDRSLKVPGSMRELLNVRELGVIPNLHSIEPATGGVKVRIAIKASQNGLIRYMRRKQQSQPSASRELIGWQQKTYFSESFRHAVASILRSNPSHQELGVLLLTSPNPSEGKTLVTANLGISMAETGRRVLIIDADFRRPRLHSIFSRSNEGTGLGNLLVAAAEGKPFEIDSAIQESGYPGLSIMANGPQLDNLSRLLHSQALPQVMNLLRAKFDMILIDAPPVLQIVDARIIHQLADGVILVIRSGTTDRRSALEAYRYLHEDKANLLGTILNDWQPQKKKVDYYYNYVREQDKSTPPAEAASSNGTVSS